jgi:hypothetical protein
MHDCPSVPRPSPWDSGTVASRWDTNCPTAVPPAPWSSNSWRASKPLQPERRDSFCPSAVPPPQSNCPKVLVPSVPMGQPSSTPWAVVEWHGFFVERAAIREHDGGLSREEAERGAWLDCLARWLEVHPPSAVALRVWPPDSLRLALLAEAVEALAALGIRQPPPPPRP